MTRPTIDETMLLTALVQAARGTCMKMQVGCVLTDARGRMLTANYNGVASGRPHCNEEKLLPEDSGNVGLALQKFPYACPGAFAPPGTDLCEAVHCEPNALTWCRTPEAIAVAYLTVSPCMRCAKELLNTPCARIVFLEEYEREPQAAALWRSARRTWSLADAAVQHKADQIGRLLGLRRYTGRAPGQGGAGKA